MELTAQEREALKGWMAEKGLSLSAVGSLVDVSKNTVSLWLKGGGLHPSQRVKLLEHIRPYLPDQDEARQVLKSLVGRDPGPSGSFQGEGARILDPAQRFAEFERRIAELERRLAAAPSPSLSEVAEPAADYGLRVVRPHEEPLRLAAGGGSPSAPSMARTAIIDGQSMEPIYRPGEEVVIEAFPEPIALGAAGYVEYSAISQRLKSGRHYYCELNEGGYMVKGIELTPPDARKVWRLELVAENKSWGEEFGYHQGRRVLHFGETLMIYGTIKKKKG